MKECTMSLTDDRVWFSGVGKSDSEASQKLDKK